MSTAPVVVEEQLAAPVDKVWEAITDKNQMPKWYFDTIEDFEPKVGFETQFNVHSEGTDYLHVWKVTEVTPHQKIAYSWRYEGYPGDSLVQWELTETEIGTNLVLTHSGIESFEMDNPVFTRESTQAGWDYLIKKNLKAYVE